MKTKLTVTVDREILPKAKRYARARGVSLSSLIEDALRAFAAEVAGAMETQAAGIRTRLTWAYCAQCGAAIQDARYHLTPGDEPLCRKCYLEAVTP